MIRRLLIWAGLGMFLCSGVGAQSPVKYEPTAESLDQHPLPEWYAGAKFGIFVCWGPYSVPGWAPLSHPDHDFDSTDFIRNNPYAEWYSNVMQIDGSATQAYHRQHYGANFKYYDSWAEIFQDTGARYVVFTTKFHDGFSMWPSQAPNPTLAEDRRHATRDIVGELTNAVRAHGMRMGFYYSGGFDWTFKFGPIEKAADYETTKPQSQAYGDYVFRQIHELIDRYHPSLLWNDIDWPKSGRPLQVEADYYNAVPDGVVDDRLGVKHTDFVTQEYRKLDAIAPKKWEENRGLGRSFGYNRAEGEAETIAPGELIALLVDIVSKNGNLLLDVGPEADGTIPAVQMERLKALGAWLRQNGEAIYDTTPWTQAVGKSAEGDDLRFTRKGPDLYVTVLGQPKGKAITMPDVPAKQGVTITELGEGAGGVGTAAEAGATRIVLPARLTGEYAYSFKLAGYAR